MHWSHQSQQTHFKIDIGVFYGRDVDLVNELPRGRAIEVSKQC